MGLVGLVVCLISEIVGPARPVASFALLDAIELSVPTYTVSASDIMDESFGGL